MQKPILHTQKIHPIGQLYLTLLKIPNPKKQIEAASIFYQVGGFKKPPTFFSYKKLTVAESFLQIDLPLQKNLHRPTEKINLQNP
jgi:hypothetical protein